MWQLLGFHSSHTLSILINPPKTNQNSNTTFHVFFSSPDHKSPYPGAQQPPNPSAKVVQPSTDKNVHQVRLNCWDTSGQDKFATLAKKYYMDAEAALVCFDLTDAASWDKLKFWVEEVQKVEPDCLIVIVGTKKDMIVPISKAVKDKYPYEDFNVSRQRAISVDDVRDYALTIGAVVFETSAKLDADLPACDHIFEVFNFIAHEVTFRREEAKALGLGQKQASPNQINMDQARTEKKDGCC